MKQSLLRLSQDSASYRTSPSSDPPSVLGPPLILQAITLFNISLLVKKRKGMTEVFDSSLLILKPRRRLARRQAYPVRLMFRGAIVFRKKLEQRRISREPCKTSSVWPMLRRSP